MSISRPVVLMRQKKQNKCQAKTEGMRVFWLIALAGKVWLYWAVACTLNHRRFNDEILGVCTRRMTQEPGEV